ncbi:MAG: hypothetical protein ACP5XB_01380 [Isosphaeraceae bacterium]
MRVRNSIQELMLLVLASAVALALLRIRWGLIFALIAGGIVGCGLAPFYANRAMHKLSGELARSGVATRTRSLLVAQSYVLVWAAWYFTGVLVALAGAGAWWLLRIHH